MIGVATIRDYNKVYYKPLPFEKYQSILKEHNLVHKPKKSYKNSLNAVERLEGKKRLLELIQIDNMIKSWHNKRLVNDLKLRIKK